jgi:FecR protein
VIDLYRRAKVRRRANVLSLAGAVLLIIASSLTPRQAVARVSFSAVAIATVRYIKNGLAIQPPNKRLSQARLKDKLYTRYLLRTRQAQKASLRFRDGSLLHINQNTSTVLVSPTMTQVKNGTVEEVVQPGTTHEVKTAVGSASAIGTRFLVIFLEGQMTVIVVEGAVMVRNSFGNTLVKSGEEATAQLGSAPSSTLPVDARSAAAWAQSIPEPKPSPGINIALDANGGAILNATSVRASPDHLWDSAWANDGRLDWGWQSAEGKISNQKLTIVFAGLRQYSVSEVILDCSATHGESQTNALKTFDIRVSTTTSADGSFATALSSQCPQGQGLQTFNLTAPTHARYLQIVAKDNWGGADGITIAEIEAISATMPSPLGTPTPSPSATPTVTPPITPTMSPVETSTFAATAETMTQTPTATPAPCATSADF